MKWMEPNTTTIHMTIPSIIWLETTDIKYSKHVGRKHELTILAPTGQAAPCRGNSYTCAWHTTYPDNSMFYLWDACVSESYFLSTCVRTASWQVQTELSECCCCQSHITSHTRYLHVCLVHYVCTLFTKLLDTCVYSIIIHYDEGTSFWFISNLL